MAKQRNDSLSPAEKTFLLRLDEDVFNQVQTRSTKEGPSMQGWIGNLLKRELDTPTTSWTIEPSFNSRLAMQIVQYCPCLFVVKELGRIKYPNPAYIATFTDDPQRWRERVLHKTIADLSPDSGQYIERHEAKARERSMNPVIEAVKPFRAKEKSIFRAIRFPIDGAAGYTGDFSFEWKTMTGDYKEMVLDWELLKQQERSISSDVQQIIFKALDEAPVAIAVKSAASRMQGNADRGKIIAWCNKTFVQSAQRVRPDLQREDIEGNLSSLDIWNLKPTHPLAFHERSVARERIWLYDEIDYGEGFVRTSLRFPLYNEDNVVVWIVSISVDFLLDHHEEAFASPNSDPR